MYVSVQQLLIQGTYSFHVLPCQNLLVSPTVFIHFLIRRNRQRILEVISVDTEEFWKQSKNCSKVLDVNYPEMEILVITLGLW